jgi:hypothetical protein
MLSHQTNCSGFLESYNTVAIELKVQCKIYVVIRTAAVGVQLDALSHAGLYFWN